MALFDKLKLGSKPAGDEPNGSDDSVAFTPDPEKAARFFDRAKAVHDSTNYEYATTLWLQGLRQDPTSMSGVEAFFTSAQAFAQSEKRDKPTKDQTAAFGGKGALEKYLLELLHWGIRPSDVGRGLRVLDLAAKLGLGEPGHWVGERTLLAAVQDKPKKSELVTLMRTLAKVGAFDLAVKAGNAALQLDNSTDANLDAEVRNMAAQMTMARGGYEKSGEAGGFRANVRDAEAQRRLIEEQSLVKSEDTVDRLINAAKADYESRPADRAAIMKYAAALRDRGRPEDDKTAFDLLTTAFKETKEFRFRQMAGEIRLKHARRKLSEIRQAAQAAPTDEKAQARFRKAHEEFLRLELEEFRLQVEAYPTDLGKRLELGIRHFLLGEDEQAIAMFQEARNDPKNRARALNYLGQSFLRMGWADEAVESLRSSLAALENPNDDAGLDIRYNLMLALEKKARDHKDPATAEEAYKIASGIAIQQINFRDIRAKRDELQRLTRELKSGGGPAPAVA